MATIETPPNHKVFDTVSAANLAPKSALHQCRLLAQAKENTTAPAPPLPQIHINLPDALFTNLVPQAPVPTPIPAPAPVSIARLPLSEMLLPENLPARPLCTVDEFCQMYDLGDNILHMLKEHGYAHTGSFKFVKIEDLRGIGLKAGEVAEMMDAVCQWAGQAL